MIGDEVRRRREGLGLTGAQLAARARMAPSSISQIETGKRTPSSASVIKLAEALGAEVGDLYPKKAQAPLPLEDASAGLDAQNLTEQDLASLHKTLDEKIAELDEEIAELRRMREEASDALIRALNGHSPS